MADQGPTLYGLTFNGAWSIGQAKRGEWYANGTKDFPDPGKYDPGFYDKPSVTLGKMSDLERQGIVIKKVCPPIGTYDVSKNIDKNDNPTYTMGLKLNLESKRMAVGPTTYNPNMINNATPQFSFGYREETQYGKDGPPPNLYQTVFDEEKLRRTMDSFKMRKTGFGTGLRGLVPKSIDLGYWPGQYNPGSTTSSGFAPKVSFAKSVREPLKKFVGPGPGQYAPKFAYSKSMGYSIGNKYIPFKTSDSETPGPGAYQPKKPSTVQNTRFGREGKFDLVDKEQAMKPGPGDYDQNLPPNKVSHLDTQSIGTSNRPPIANINNVPGPGQYESDLLAVEGPKYSLRPKNERYIVNQNPGPGQYDPQELTDKPLYHYTVPYTSQPGPGAANRSTPIYSKFKNVGPGSYNLNAAQLGGSKISIGKAQRFKETPLEDVGPALYRVPDTIGKIPNYLLDKNKETKFMSLQAEEQKLRLSQKFI